MGVAGMAKLSANEDEPGYAVTQVRVRVVPDGRMSREHAALYLGVKPKTLAMWALHGRGPRSLKVGGRVFYLRGDLDAFIRDGSGGNTRW
jgi:hypothetical protein